MKNPLPLIMLLVLFCAAPSPAADLVTDRDLTVRLNQLEAQTQALRAELQWLREHPVRLPGAMTTPASLSRSVTVPTAEQADYISRTEFRAQMKKLAWTKGDCRVVPYGILWGNMVGATARTTPGSYTLYVPSAEDQGEGQFVVDGRTTRMGLDVAGPRLWLFNCARVGGRVEFDFQGNFSSTENRGGVLLRHAYAELKNDEFRLLLGQTWDVVSPLVPGTIMYSVCWDGGNIGYRRGQLRGERYLAFSDTFLLTLQGSLNQNIVSDFVTDPLVRSEAAGWPLIEGRTAVTLGPRGGYHKPITFGVSGHIGEQGFDVLDAGGQILVDDVRRRTWSLNVDVNTPITDRLGFKGEFFTGENLSTFLGGIGQGINTTTRRTIRSTGGWLETYYYLGPSLHTHVGYGLDDPFNTDITTGRTYNQFCFGNLIYDVTKKFQLGFEVSSWKTLYATKQPGKSLRFEFAAKYGF